MFRISIHAPLRERLLHAANSAVCFRFQSTLPYGSDLGQTIITKVRALISIHAPLRERRWQLYLPYGQSHFNPRSLTGATALLYHFFRTFTISIHAPLRERQSLSFDCLVSQLFQSTLPYGSEEKIDDKNNSQAIFQSTLPYGSDLAWPSLRWNKLTDFNPRSLTGATVTLRIKTVRVKISIHAPSRERPGNRARRSDNQQISIHAPSRERPNFNKDEIFRVVISIHAPSRERRNPTSDSSYDQLISIHAPSRERL